MGRKWEEFFDEDGVSKGLFNSCVELKLIPENSNFKDFCLEKLREIISSHPAFDQRSNLEILAEKYGVILLFWPKFHCELNPFESVRCFIKQYIKRKTDRTFETMVHLIEEAKVEFKEGNLIRHALIHNYIIRKNC